MALLRRIIDSGNLLLCQRTQRGRGAIPVGKEHHVEVFLPRQRRDAHLDVGEDAHAALGAQDHLADVGPGG